MKINKAALAADKKAIEVLGFYRMENSDREIIKHVIESLNDTGAKLVLEDCVKAVPVISSALNDFSSVFGSDIAEATGVKFFQTPIRITNLNLHAFAVNVQYLVEQDTWIVDKDSAFVDNIKFPCKVTGSDRVSIGHEFVHINKEFNYEEYKLALTLSDVIPMLYEFIVMGEHANNVINNRLFTLGLNVREYEFANFKVKSGFKDKDLFKVMCDRNGQYLNSFYYATILYKMYQNNSRMILDYMKRVINCEITTLDMLKEIGIYWVDNNELYDEQVKEFRGIIRK